jgi:recombinational DNA repair protein (RecF pathway)
MTDLERCGRCGEDTRAGTRRFAGRRRLADGRILCRECAHEDAWELERAEVPITNPNTNFPNTH